MTYEGEAFPHLGELWIGMSPGAECRFRASPARSVHAALLRRLELIDPELSQALHEAQAGSHASDHPWTISPLIGQMKRVGEYLVAVPDWRYRVRVTALAPRVIESLSAAFDSDKPIGRDPLVLESVPFEVAAASTHWERLSTYPALLTNASARRRITLKFHSPAGFRTRRSYGLAPPPRLCVEGYLRKWNAFSNLTMPTDELLAYVDENIRIADADLRDAAVRFGKYSVAGVVGSVTWEALEVEPHMLRLVNTLVDYASYCGTGTLTSQGMGQTALIG